MHNTETELRFRRWTLRGVRFFPKLAHMLAVAVHGAELTTELIRQLLTEL